MMNVKMALAAAALLFTTAALPLQSFAVQLHGQSLLGSTPDFLSHG